MIRIAVFLEIVCLDPAFLYDQLTTQKPVLFAAALIALNCLVQRPRLDILPKLKAVTDAPCGTVMKLFREEAVPAFKVLIALNLIFGLGFE